MTSDEMRDALKLATAFDVLVRNVPSAYLLADTATRGRLIELFRECSDAITKRGATFATLASAIKHHRFGCAPATSYSDEIPDDKTPAERPSRKP